MQRALQHKVANGKGRAPQHGNGRIVVGVEEEAVEFLLSGNMPPKDRVEENVDTPNQHDGNKHVRVTAHVTADELADNLAVFGEPINGL